MTMLAHRGFTLAEMLAVIGIMLILMVATFGVFGVFAERMGPEAAVSTVQAMLNGARDYAASNGDAIFAARIMFTTDPKNSMDGTTMTLQYMPRDDTKQWVTVGNRRPISLGNQVFVCYGLPDLGTVSVPAAVDPADLFSGKNVEDKMVLWRTYEKDLREKVSTWALATDGLPNTVNQKFYLVFDPTGYMVIDANVLQAFDSTMNDKNTVQSGLTIIQSAGGKVTGYATYPMNPNTGTRLVFE
jgi:prepilin-type N-terminal cleavage/methylation domain-containing protein